MDNNYWEKKYADMHIRLTNRIAELEKENADLKEEINKIAFARGNLEEENAELRKVAEFQQSSNMNRYFENKKLKEGLAVGSTFNKALNSMNKNLEEERDKYRNMVFDKDDQLTKAKEIIKKLVDGIRVISDPKVELTNVDSFVAEAEQFLSDNSTYERIQKAKYNYID
jgi:prefoldin subunit 5